jgi:XTP/dITP diphosphohydrolase
LLLKKLNGKDRTAHFISVVVLYFPDGSYLSAEGKVEGSILETPRGNGGFGYDPLFFSHELQKTFAEASAEEKNSISHRARALQSLLNKLTETDDNR